jgi:hypothetical protein
MRQHPSSDAPSRLRKRRSTAELQAILVEFDSGTSTSNPLLLRTMKKCSSHIFTHRPLSRVRQLLIGALFSGEYALESAALFNPSIVPHPGSKRRGLRAACASS